MQKALETFIPPFQSTQVLADQIFNHRLCNLTLMAISLLKCTLKLV